MNLKQFAQFVIDLNQEEGLTPDALFSLQSIAKKTLKPPPEPIAVIHKTTSVIEMEYLIGARNLPQGSHKVYITEE